MPRFTISHHTGSKEGDHYDLMLEQGDALKTWRLHNTAFQTPQAAPQIKDHRKTYLDYEGEVSGGRGRVRIWDTGLYAADEWMDDRIRVALVGRQVKIRLNLERMKGSDPSAEPTWIVGDAAMAVRKTAAAFLRGASLEEAPTPELEEFRTALVHEEQKLLALVDQYTRGGTMEWSLVETDAELRRKIDRQKARWQHPWLAAAKAYADKIAQLSEVLRQHRPAGPT